jgi:folylpolyglutamate synthase/dihydropteroate synthase
MLTACQGSNPHCQAVEGVANAIAEGKRLAGRDGLVMISGSLYTVGEAISYLEGQHGP